MLTAGWHSSFFTSRQTHLFRSTGIGVISSWIKRKKTMTTVGFQLMSDMFLNINSDNISIEVCNNKKFMLIVGNCGHGVPAKEKDGSPGYEGSGYQKSAFYEFLSEMAALFVDGRVFFVPGYVEYNSEYGCDKVTIDHVNHVFAVMQQSWAAKGTRITILQKGRYTFDDVPLTLLGCTLWCPKPEGMSDEKLTKVSGIWDRLNMQRVCADGSIAFKQMTPSDTNQLHNNHLEWLQEAITDEYDKNNDVIILTSFAPTLDDACFGEALLDTPLSFTKGSNARAMLRSPNVPTDHIRAWCFGSSLKTIHANARLCDPKTNVQWLSNPKGNPQELNDVEGAKADIKFQANFAFDITVKAR